MGRKFFLLFLFVLFSGIALGEGAPKELEGVRPSSVLEMIPKAAAGNAEARKRLLAVGKAEVLVLAAKGPDIERSIGQAMWAMAEPQKNGRRVFRMTHGPRELVVPMAKESDGAQSAVQAIQFLSAVNPPAEAWQIPPKDAPAPGKLLLGGAETPTAVVARLRRQLTALRAGATDGATVAALKEMETTLRDLEAALKAAGCGPKEAFPPGGAKKPGGHDE